MKIDLTYQDNIEWIKQFEDESIDCIYTDPPYDSKSKLSYKDNHKDWNKFIKLRLIEFKRVLKPTGTCILHIDENSLYELKSIMDEVFGKHNFILNRIWNKHQSKQMSKLPVHTYENILIYGKDKKKTIYRKSLKPMAEKMVKQAKIIYEQCKDKNDAETKFKQWMKKNNINDNYNRYYYNCRVIRNGVLATGNELETQKNEPIIDPMELLKQQELARVNLLEIHHKETGPHDSATVPNEDNSVFRNVRLEEGYYVTTNEPHIPNRDTDDISVINLTRGFLNENNKLNQGVVSTPSHPLNVNQDRDSCTDSTALVNKAYEELNTPIDDQLTRLKIAESNFSGLKEDIITSEKLNINQSELKEDISLCSDIKQLGSNQSGLKEDKLTFSGDSIPIFNRYDSIKEDKIISLSGTENNMKGDWLSGKQIDIKSYGKYIINIESNNSYDILHPTTNQVCKRTFKNWRYKYELMEDRINKGLIEFGKDHTILPRDIYFLEEHMTQNNPAVIDWCKSTARGDVDYDIIRNFTYAKPIDLCKEVVYNWIFSGAVLLDPFAGSLSSAHAVIDLGEDLTMHCCTLDEGEVKQATEKRMDYIKRIYDFTVEVINETD